MCELWTQSFVYTEILLLWLYYCATVTAAQLLDRSARATYVDAVYC